MSDTRVTAAPTPIVIVGHVDHGKSTLIGRLLHESGNLPEGRLEAAKASSARRGLAIEWSHLLDSLQAERDQGVTIDSTRLPFRLGDRHYVIVDAPGHRQFIRNMLTGAADAAAAVLVVDLAEGAREQTRRHAMLLRLIGVRHVVVLMNKADLLDYDAVRIGEAREQIAALLARLDIQPAAMIPASAREGVNITAHSGELAWYDGPTLTEALLAVPAASPATAQPARLGVQDVYRRDEGRIVVGRVDAGRFAVGDTVAIGKTGATARIARFPTWHDQPPAEVVAGQSVALLLEPDVVVARGDLLHHVHTAPLRGRRLRTRLFWLRQTPLRLGETLRLRLGTFETNVTVTEIIEVVDTDALAGARADEVPPEGFAELVLAAAESVLFDAFVPGEGAGRGVLVDTGGQIVAAAPLIGLADAEEARLADGAPAAPRGVYWLTGLPGSGKSTVTEGVAAALTARGERVMVLDGDLLRRGLNEDLGYSMADRTENVRRTAHVARLLAQAGAVVLVALISPLRMHRALAREIVGEGFHEVHVAADVAVCATRDPKGHYAAANAGRIQGYTGTDGSYETPEAPDLRLVTVDETVATSVARLLDYIRGR